MATLFSVFRWQDKFTVTHVLTLVYSVHYYHWFKLLKYIFFFYLMIIFYLKIVLESDREWNTFVYWLYAFQTVNHRGFCYREGDRTHPFPSTLPIHPSIFIYLDPNLMGFWLRSPCEIKFTLERILEQSFSKCLLFKSLMVYYIRFRSIIDWNHIKFPLSNI